MTMSYQILIHKVADPKAVAVVIGGLGQTTQNVQEVFSLPLYSTTPTTTISAASPPFAFALHNLQPTAASVIQETAQVLRETPSNVPLVLHVFSNGGAIVLEQMEVVLRKTLQQDPSQNTNTTVTRQDAQLVQDRMGYQFFDSSPCYLHEIWSPTTVTKSFPNKDWSTLGRSVYYLGSACSLTFWNLATLSLHRPRQFWHNMEVLSPCQHQIYAYSTADMLSDAYRVEQLIERRREKGVDVASLKYQDSGHCTLFQDHPEEYLAAVNEALRKAMERAAKKR